MKFDYQERIKKIQQKLVEENLDVFLAAVVQENSKNLVYLCGFGGTAGVLAISRDDAVLCIDDRYTERAQKEVTSVRVVSAGLDDRTVTDFTNYVKTAFSELNTTSNSRVGFESLRVTYAMAKAWESIGKGTLVPTEFLVESVRGTKDSGEINCIKEACEKTCAVLNEHEGTFSAGMTEREVAHILDDALRNAGIVENAFPTVVASGPNSAMPHYETGNRVLVAGEVLLIDIGGTFESGYSSDITRTYFVPGKEPDQKLVEIYKIVLEANRAAREQLTIGMTWKEYDAVAREVIESSGYGKYFIHGLGHSLGLEPHAHDPYDYANTPFEDGLVITDEPGIYVPDLGGVRIEDDLVLTKDGVINLTESASYLFD